MGVRITQAAVEVLRDGDAHIRLTQAAVEVLRNVVAPDVKLALTQMAVEVLRKSSPQGSISVTDDIGDVADSVMGALTRIANGEALDPLSISDLVSATLWRAITSSLVDSIGAVQDIVSGTLNPVRYASVIDSLSLSDTAKGAGITLSSRNRWVAPIDITPATGLIDPVHIAAHPIRHPEKFYAPRVKSYGQFTRSIGVPVGFVRTGDCQLSIVDADNEFRQAISPKTIINGRAEVRLGPEGGPLSAFLRPFIRSVSAVDQPGDGEIRITLRDFITQSFEQQIPPLVTRDNFPNLPEESNGAFAPIIYGNVSVQNYLANVNPDTFIGDFVSDVLRTILSRVFTGPNPGGAIKAILVDPSTRTYLVARHPCRSVKAYKYSNETIGYVSAGLYTAFTQQIPSGEVCQFISLPYDPEGAEIRVNVEAIIDSAGAGGSLNEFIGFYGHGWPLIDSIGMIYSPLGDDEIRRTEEAGDEAAWSVPVPTDPAGEDAPSSEFVGFYGHGWPYINTLGLIYSPEDTGEILRTEEAGDGDAWVNIEPPEVSGTTNNFVGFFGRGWPYIDTIGILYSPEGSSELKRTEEAGDEEGGFAYADTTIPAGKTIAGIRIWSADYIDAIQLIYKDGLGALSYGTKHGGPGGTLKTFTFQDGEYILRIRGKFGRYIDSLVIETNLRTSTWYGGTGGAYGSYSIAINTPPDPEAITPVDGIVFSDGPIPDGCHISAIKVWSGTHVDALQLVYKDGVGVESYGSKHGGGGGTLSTFTLETDEYILEVRGKYGTFIDSMTIVTNTRTATFGGGGGSLGTYALKINDAPAGDSVVIGAFAFTDSPIPDGCRISAIRIWSSTYIDGLQLVYKDGDGVESYGTRHGFGDGTMRTLTLEPGEFIIKIRGNYGAHISSLVIETNLKISMAYGGGAGELGTYDLTINGAATGTSNPAAITAQSGDNFADAILETLTAHLGITKSAEFLNAESFTETRTRVASLICAGAFTKAITWGEALTQLQRSSNIDLFCDRHDRLTVRYATDDDEPVVNLTDLTELYGGSVKQSMAAPAFNRLPYRFMPNYADDTWEEKNWDNVGDQVASGAIMADEPLQLYFVRDPETALKVAERRGDFVDLDAFRFEGTVPLIPTVDKLELAQIVGIDHFGGMKAGGYVNEQFKITDLSMDLDNLAYNFKGIRRRLPTPVKVEGEIDGRSGINARHGPFSNNVDGELFAVFKHKTLNRMAVLRSVDYGANWVESDADNVPAIAPNSIVSLDAVDLNGDLHIATQEKTTGRIVYHRYSMSKREWEIVDQEVVASHANINRFGLSIEWRYPDETIFIYHQGEREKVGAAWYERGYYSKLVEGTWSAPALATKLGDAFDHSVQRAISGRSNRMHFFYSLPWYDEYVSSMSEGGTLSNAKIIAANLVYSSTARNAGAWAINADRTRIYIPRRGYLLHPFVEVVSEGFPAGHIKAVTFGETVPFFGLTNDAPAIFSHVDHEDGAVSAVWADDNWNSIFLGGMSDIEFDDESLLQAGPSNGMAGNSSGLSGNILTVRGRQFLAYFQGDYIPEKWVSRWLRIDRLPYTG